MDSPCFTAGHDPWHPPRNKVTSALAQLFFVATSMTRDDAGVDLNDGAAEGDMGGRHG